MAHDDFPAGGDDPLALLAQSLIDDGRRDRQVLHRRWEEPPWSYDIREIAGLLQAHPQLVAATRQFIESLVAPAGDSLLSSESAPDSHDGDGHAD